jgi:hypothetical protein
MKQLYQKLARWLRREPVLPCDWCRRERGFQRLAGDAYGICSRHRAERARPAANNATRPITIPASYPLFEHMLDTYGLTLIEDELNQIMNKVDEVRMKGQP